MLVYAKAVGDASNLVLVFLHAFSTSAAVFNEVRSNLLLETRMLWIAVLHGMFILPTNILFDLLILLFSEGTIRLTWLRKESETGVEASLYLDSFGGVFRGGLGAFEVKKALFVGW